MPRLSVAAKGRSRKEREQMSDTRKVEIEDEDGNSKTVEVPVEVLASVEFSPSEALQAAITAGHVKTSNETVSVKQKDKDGNVVKVFEQSYLTLTAVNLEGALILAGGDEDKLWAAVSEKTNQNAYQNVYVRLRNAAQGPEKAIAKVNKVMAGLSEEQKAAVKAALGLS